MLYGIFAKTDFVCRNITIAKIPSAARTAGNACQFSSAVFSSTNRFLEQTFTTSFSIIAVNDAMKQIDKETEKMLGAYGSQLNGLF